MFYSTTFAGNGFAQRRRIENKRIKPVSVCKLLHVFISLSLSLSLSPFVLKLESGFLGSCLSLGKDNTYASAFSSRFPHHSLIVAKLNRFYRIIQRGNWGWITHDKHPLQKLLMPQGITYLTAWISTLICILAASKSYVPTAS